MGDLKTWDMAEAKLTQALDNFSAAGGGQWELNEGDGAFYGPKIDIYISDALKREHQCATIQLDFQLPQNFGLEYMTAEMSSKPKDTEGSAKKADGGKPNDAKADGPSSTSNKPEESEASAQKADGAPAVPKALGPGRARPVMIHRAIIGSFERFMAILIEHFAGKWPFWLSPRQVLVVPVTTSVNDYVLEVQKLLKEAKMHVDVDISGNTMQKKIRTGQLQQYNFIFGTSALLPGLY